MTCAILFLITSLVTVATAQKPQVALPRVRIDTTWNLPMGGTTWSAHTSAQLTSALASAAPDDIIVLDAGVTYIGNFVVPAKSNLNNKWIYVKSSAYSKLPAPGTRVSPRDSANMPKIVTPNVSQALRFKDGANYWRFVGVEIYSASTCSPPNCTMGVKYFGMVATFSYPPVKLPDHIVFDRVYVHGDDTHDVQGGIAGNMTNVAVVDSYISAIHMGGMDTQAFAAWYTPGPIKLVNNHLEAAGENVMFGGGGGPNDPYVPSDIEIRNNYLYKPLSWAKAGVTLPPHAKWWEKNAFEIKSAQRVLFDSNIIENVWASAQTGTAVVLTVRSGQSGNIAVVNDITLTNNVLTNVVSGFVGLAADYTCASSSYPNCTNAGSQDRWNIRNNLIKFYNPSLPGGAGNFGMMFDPGFDHVHNTPGVMRDVVFQHNTMIPAASTSCRLSVYFSVPPGAKPPLRNITHNIWLLDNAMCNEPTGDWQEQGTPGLTQYMGTPSTPPYDVIRRFYGNVMYVSSNNKIYTFPPHNLATTVPFTYVNPPIGDYQLLTPYWTDTSDGRLAGINFSKLPTSPGP